MQPTKATWGNAQQVLVFLEDNWAFYKNDAAQQAVVDAATAELFQRPSFESMFNFMLDFLLASKHQRCSAAYPLLVSTLCSLIRGTDLLFEDTDDKFLQRAVVEEASVVLREVEASLSGNANYTVGSFVDCHEEVRKLLASGRPRDDRLSSLLQLVPLKGETHTSPANLARWRWNCSIRQTGAERTAKT